MIDLTDAYARHATRAQRGFAMLDRKRLLIQDEIVADKPVEYLWLMHTAAKITIADNGRSATLEQGGKKVTARLLSPADAKFTVTEAKSLPTSPPEPPAAKNPMLKPPTDLTNIRRLTARIEGQSELRVSVLLDTTDDAAPQIRRLADWGD